MGYETIEDILTEKIARLPASRIEDFLGYAINHAMIGSISERIREKLDSLEEDELLDVESEYWDCE